MTDREPTKSERQAAAAALDALNNGDLKRAAMFGALLDMTIEDNDKAAENAQE
ncbi:hypothetical protein SAMN04489729_3456 [Amycolatopsis lurida]|uniref:hypothetical protein n=1 Tax=Amycolatopsis lurida TaxID=31959 RepID=UPI00089B8D3A|nr:hypothetical protein [Amycolatopsis lurida]SED13264.1 hypothetical protein SAMN04489729_3456 [Amycolatopsis lurida]